MSEFESFDYTKVTVAENQMSQYMDGYEHFGWKVDSNEIGRASCRERV